MFWQDIYLALGFGLLLDSEVLRPNRLLRLLGRFGYVLVLVYSCLMIKFYVLFRSFLNRALLMQADNVFIYWKEILGEMDVLTWGLILAGLAYAYCVERFAEKHLHQALGHPAEKSRAWALRPIPVFMILGVAYLALFFAFGQRAGRGQNFYSLDKNPCLELAGSYLSDAPQRPQLFQTLSKPAGREQAAQPASRPAAMDPGMALQEMSLAERNRLNVVIILMETTALEYTGLEKPDFRSLTPNLCRLAASSLVLENHYCQEPASLKSLYAILTGKYSYQTRNWKSFIRKARGDATLPERLKAKGYATVFMTSADGRIYSENDFLRGRFDDVIDMNVIQKRGYQVRHFSNSVDDRVLVPIFRDFLNQHQQGRFMALIYPTAPHHPYEIPSDEFKRARWGRRPSNGIRIRFFTPITWWDSWRVCWRPMAWATRPCWWSCPTTARRFSSIRETICTPFISMRKTCTRWASFTSPKLVTPGVYGGLSSNVDIAPTVLDLLGLEGKGMDGASLVKPGPAREVYFYTSFNHQRFGLREDYWKYLQDPDYQSEELYDLGRDPHEKRNLAANEPDRCGQYRDLLESLQKKILR